MMKFFIFKILTISLLISTSLQCYALISVGNVSREAAREMGIEVKSRPSGPDMQRVTLRFKKAGKLKDFNVDHGGQVELRLKEIKTSLLREPKPLLHASLQTREIESDTVSVDFTIAQKQISQANLMIIVWSGTRTASGYMIDLKEFLTLE